MFVSIEVMLWLSSGEFGVWVVKLGSIVHAVEDDILSKLDKSPRNEAKLAQHVHNVSEFLKDGSRSNHALIMKNFINGVLVHDEEWVHLFLIDLFLDEDVEPVPHWCPEIVFFDIGII